MGGKTVYLVFCLIMVEASFSFLQRPGKRSVLTNSVWPNDYSFPDVLSKTRPYLIREERPYLKMKYSDDELSPDRRFPKYDLGRRGDVLRLAQNTAENDLGKKGNTERRYVARGKAKVMRLAQNIERIYENSNLAKTENFPSLTEKFKRPKLMNNYDLVQQVETNSKIEKENSDYGAIPEDNYAENDDGH